MNSDNAIGLAGRLQHVLLRDRWIHFIAISFSAFTGLVGLAYGQLDRISLLLYPELAFLAIGTASFFFSVIYLFKVIFAGHKRPLTYLVGRVIALLKRPEEIFAFVAASVSIILFVSAFTSLKSIIPVINPFSWDQTFMALDEALHFGTAPWEYTHALGGTALSAFLTFLYHLWFFLYWSLLLYTLFRPDLGRLRIRYQVSHLSCWILIGGFTAIMLSSGGPCYYGFLVDGPDPYAPLFERLNAQQTELIAKESWLKIWPLDLQAKLWDGYLNTTTGVGSGISAMPSMHVAIAVLMALACGKLNKWLGYAAWVYAILIQIGSFHLGWHYAIDGYLSAILVFIIWKVAGKLTDRIPEEMAGLVERKEVEDGV